MGTLASERPSSLHFSDHPSLTASLEDFEPSDRERSPHMWTIPSAHSGFLSNSVTSSEPESDPAVSQWSPPAWRKPSSGWYERKGGPTRFSPVRSHSRSRDRSIGYGSADEGDITLPANVPLPASPEKGTPRETPIREVDEYEHERAERARSESIAPEPVHDNYIRFAVRAEVQQRTEPIEAVVTWTRHKIDLVTKSRTNAVVSVLIGFLSIFLFRVLFASPAQGYVPDLVKVAGIAKSLEPMIYYSEHGVKQIEDLQDTGVAVWDLGETIRHTNLTSATIIVGELDELGDGLKRLAIELTKFFANVDGDIDSVLIVMEWARRELSAYSSSASSPLTSAYSNLHTMLTDIGLLENAHTGRPTALGRVLTALFGQTPQQKTRGALQRTFHEFLNVLEESINNELQYSAALFTLFEQVDRKFLNLQRIVVRESAQQDREESELLSSLWTKVMGANAKTLAKFERNKKLLTSIRERTVRNKHVLEEHNARLRQLQERLENLRRRLINPLVRSNESSTLSVAEQIRGIQGTHEHLRELRERQKSKVLEMIFGPSRRQSTLVAADRLELEGR